MVLRVWYGMLVQPSSAQAASKLQRVYMYDVAEASTQAKQVDLQARHQLLTVLALGAKQQYINIWTVYLTETYFSMVACCQSQLPA